MARIAVVYATRQGASRQTAQIIASTAEAAGHDVVLSDVRRLPSDVRAVSGFDAVIIGSSIVMGRWVGRARRFARRALASGTPTALWVTAAGVLQGGAGSDTPPPRDEAVQRACNLFIAPLLSSRSGTGVPLAMTAFGGIMKMYGRVVIDNWEREPIEEWTTALLADLSARIG